MYLRSLQIRENENNNSFHSSKEANIINNNILSNQRVFGRELTNIDPVLLYREKKLGAKSSLQQLPSKTHYHTASQPHLMLNHSFKGDMDIPKTTRDPLLPTKDMSLCFDSILEKKVFSQHSKSMVLETFSQKNSGFAEMEDADLQEINNPQFVPHYAKEIFAYLRTVEDKYIAKPGYMKTQSDINEKMRGILVDWLVDVHIKFKLLPETLFLTVNLIDRYLEKSTTGRAKLQLVGVASLLIACKYEEIYPPETKELAYVTDKAYSKDEILEMEGKILGTLTFHLTITSSLRFFERYAKLVNMDQRSQNFCKYMMELALLDYKMLKFSASLQASAAIYICNRVMKREAWPDVLAKNTKYDETAIKQCAKELLALVLGAEHSQLQAIKRKYSAAKYNEVSKIIVDSGMGV